jgi:membrane-associated phospholipid phosphatase
MKNVLLIGIALLLLAAPAHAEEPTPFRWGTHEQIPLRISDAILGLDLGLDAWHSLVKTDARARWGFACRVGLTFGIVEVAKRVIHRERPNHLDFVSMPSGHSAQAAAAAHSSLSASLALTVAWGRQAGGMHYGTDAMVGAGVGLLSRKVCPE